MDAELLTCWGGQTTGEGKAKRWGSTDLPRAVGLGLAWNRALMASPNPVARLQVPFAFAEVPSAFVPVCGHHLRA